jgi:signal transduction histidine kinase
MKIPFWPKSLQFRILLAVFLGGLLVSLLVGFLILRMFADYANREFNAEMLAKWRFWCTTPYFSSDDKFAYRMGVADWDRVMDPTDKDFFTMFVKNADGSFLKNADGSLFTASPPGMDKASPYGNRQNEVLPIIGGDSRSPVIADITLPDGSRGRAVGGMFDCFKAGSAGQKAASRPVVLVAAKRLDRLEDSVRKLRNLLIQASTIGLLSVLGTVAWVVSQNVRPVLNLAKQIKSHPVSESGNRFTLENAPLEVERVVDRLNNLMTRVDEALLHERQFTNNAAHEMRTPIAGMRATVEALLTKTRKVEEYEDALFSINDMLQKLNQLVENLLLLARLESGQREFVWETLPFPDFVRNCWKPYLNLAADRSLSFKMHLEGSTEPVSIPSSLLGIVLRNLFRNAVDYTPQRGGKIEVRGTAREGICEIQVANTNPGLDAENLERLFQPFWRADKSGDPNQGNSGIGLALCRQIMTVLDGSISASLNAEGLLSMKLRMPLTGAQPSLA